MDKGMFSFDLLSRERPNITIGNSLKQIEQATNGYVIGNIAKYDGPIYSYTKEKTEGLLAGLQPTKTTVKVDIQKKLGEQNSEQNRFEVFLTVKGLEHYKYRMMFVDYCDIAYPVTIVMDEALAAEYNGRRNYIFKINSEKELEEMLDVVINSNTMISLIQLLIDESLRQELMV